MFTKADSHPSFSDLANRILARWQREKTFEASLEKSKDKPEFIFYDGPPFPTGSPHHGTIFVSILKDLIPRYKTMRGYHVPRAWGWDCHGLPIETMAEKNLGITDKTEIEKKVGVKAFNDECRRIVSESNEAWRIYIDRIGRWVSFDDPFSTLDLTYMESVIWAFSEIYKKGLIYKDFRVSPYCYRCETPLSLSDIRLDDSTRPRQDRTITVKFPIEGQSNTFVLAWTTTPWTLPSNLALAVNPDLNYVKVKVGEEFWILSEGAVARYLKEIGDKPEIVENFLGKDLSQKQIKYTPLFPYFKDQNPNGFKFLLGDFVLDSDGTGVVHMAPAFGEDDYWLCKRNGISVIAPVDEQGKFTSEVSDFVGQNVHEANAEIIKHLKSKSLVVRDQTIDHDYPHCWRCRMPVIYKALDAWYVKVEEFKDRLSANNELIEWFPENVKHGRFGKWLQNARDWNISRNRYWATPIPVWECNSCDNRDVLGSVNEIQEKSGIKINDLHKEFLDPITYGCKCGGKMIRTPEVLDCWFESGSMPYGQYHYPFERSEHFRSHFPSDFIVEYSGQIRGWFYMLHVLSTALFDKPAFKNCMVTGTLLAADGKKISKSQKNYTDPLALIDKYGPDALRAYLLSSVAVLMEDLSFQDEGVEGMVKGINLPLWNALLFFTTYAEIDKITPEEIEFKKWQSQLTEIDKFILSELEIFIDDITKKLDGYLINEATRLIPGFLDTLNNWFIRRGRPRVWSSDARDSDKMVFYATLYRVLSHFTQVVAPFCPFLAEAVWEKLGYSESIHLSSWPVAVPELISQDLSQEISLVRKVIRAGLAIRAREKIRVRQPLSKVRLALNQTLDLSKYGSTIKEELNVKDVEILKNSEEIATRIGRANARVLGPKYGGAVQQIIKSLKEGNFAEESDGSISVGEFKLNSNEVEIVYLGKEGLKVESIDGIVVALDSEITPELELEGRARDLIRQIQELRKEADLNLSDRIILSVSGADDILLVHKEYIKQETLCVEFKDNITNPLVNQKVEIGSVEVMISLVK